MPTTVCDTAPITVGVEDLAEVTKLFGTSDYFLEFRQNCIYFCWVATAAEVQKCIDDCLECIDVRIGEEWIDLYGTYEHTGERLRLPNDQALFSCRYILETN